MNNIIHDDTKSPEQNRRLEGDKPSKDIFDSPRKRQKPQISSIPGISPKQLNRYRVTVGDEILAIGLTSDEALAFVTYLKTGKTTQLPIGSSAHSPSDFNPNTLS